MKYVEYTAQVVAVALLYLLGVEFADFCFPGLPGVITSVWPSAGIAFAAVFLFSPRIWPGIVLGVMLSHYVVSELPAIMWVYSMVANTSAPVIAFLLLRRFWEPGVVKPRLANGLAWLTSSVILAIISATIGVSGLLHTGVISWLSYGSSWSQWFMGDFFGVLVCAPSIIGLGLRSQQKQANTRKERLVEKRIAERLFWCACLATVGLLLLLVDNINPTYAAGLHFLPIMMLIWSAMRFSFLQTQLASMVTGLSAFAFASKGLGGFVQPRNIMELTVLLLYLCTLLIVPFFVAVFTYERRFFLKKLAWRADHDSLTGLMNRAALETQTASLMKRPDRTEEKLALCYLDLDQFKVVNDTCGHRVGDHLIQQISSVLQRCLEEGDLLARTGGDEFGILLRNCQPLDAEARADKFRSAIEEFRFVWEERIFAFTISIGVVPVTRLPFDRLLSLADTACYTAKELGRNRVKMILAQDAHKSHNRKQIEWVVAINEALEQNRFRLYCQTISPIIGSETDYLHFEILLRMLDKKGELLSPGVFIPAAERFHLMSKIDRWVIDNTFAWFLANPKMLEKTNACSINLSGSSIGDPEFQPYLEQVFRETGIPARKICFEITETAAIGDLSHAISLISAMRAIGCRFALDDFGSGLSSFSYLKTLDVDFLKIDGAFVREIARLPVDLAMVKSINEVGQIMGKKTIAEYVENDSINSALMDLGVDYAQGFAVHEPQAIDEFFENQRTHA